MKIKLDENLPVRLVHLLSNLGHETDTVPHEGLAGRDDLSVWEAAQHAKRLLITQDLDFADIRRYVPGMHDGVMLVRLRNPSRRALIARIQMVFQTEDVERWRGCFIVITERKIRVRYPKERSSSEP